MITQALFFMGVYLLVMTSTKPGDAAAGLLLGLGLAVALRPRLPGGRPATPPLIGLVALGPVLATTASGSAEIITSAALVLLFVLITSRSRPTRSRRPRCAARSASASSPHSQNRSRTLSELHDRHLRGAPARAVPLLA